jgi:predicted Zn-dependent peptidase
MGGGMSSRLFQRVREDRGLAYSIFAYLECFRETGLWATGLALKPEWTNEALALIFEEFRILRRDGLRPGELQSARAQLRGSTLLSLESTSNRMSRLGRAEFTHGRQLTIRELVNAIDSVNEADVIRVAGRVLDPEALSLVVVGPLEASRLDVELPAA